MRRANMASKNLRIPISFRNDNRDFEIYAHLQGKRDKSSYVKDLIEADMLKEKDYLPGGK